MTKNYDAQWIKLRTEVEKMASDEPLLSFYLNSVVLDQKSFEAALSSLLSWKLATAHVDAAALQSLFFNAFNHSESIKKTIKRDLDAIVERDPAARGYAEPFLNFKGFHALEAYRVSHVLWTNNKKVLALFLQNRIAEVFSLDIHPAARVGKGILIDHGTSVVIGETAVIGDDVSLLHEVTLGGTGKEQGDRHPKVGNGVLIGAGAKILGNVKIGNGSKVGAGSVVLDDVPEHCTVAGIPARVVGHPKTQKPSLLMDQSLDGEFQINISYSSSML